MKKDVYILGIESSCDETSCAIVKNGCEEICTKILSQIDIHTLYGGVVPEIASRNHVKDITIVMEECLKEAKMTFEEIDAIAVTYGPGLIGSLLVGLEAAKTLAFVLDKPLIGVHHIAGHIYANNLEKPLEFPLIALVISGGHTNLVYMKDHFSFENIGETLDDAVGECYDKVARVMNIPYPGGPTIDKLAHKGNPIYYLPTPIKEDSYHFSFSGLKSAVINFVHNKEQRKEEISKEDLCASFQKVVVDTLTEKTLTAMKNLNVKKLVLAGGVAASRGIRDEFSKKCLKLGYDFSYPRIQYCTDNATMIAAAGYYLYQKKEFAPRDLNAKSSDSLFSK